MSDGGKPVELGNSGCKRLIQALVGLADIVLLALSIWGLHALHDYYVPWYAISRHGSNVYVRPGPDKDYAHVDKLRGSQPVLIVDEVYDWYVLSRKPVKMVRQDTMTALKCNTDNPCYSQIEYMITNPPWHLVAIALLWFWPRIRSSLWRRI